MFSPWTVTNTKGACSTKSITRDRKTPNKLRIAKAVMVIWPAGIGGVIRYHTTRTARECKNGPRSNGLPAIVYCVGICLIGGLQFSALTTMSFLVLARPFWPQKSCHQNVSTLSHFTHFLRAQNLLFGVITQFAGPWTDSMYGVSDIFTRKHWKPNILVVPS